ncbi:MAG: hypothetical protein V1661_01540 [bacterium]
MPKEINKFITLKEAAEISGYAPDYIGQLIRKGKLPGKQVYCNVAWMTTEGSVRRYLEGNRGQKNNVEAKSGWANKFEALKAKIRPQIDVMRLPQIILYTIIVFSVSFLLLLLYVFSVNFEKQRQKALIAEMRATTMAEVK